MEPLAGLRFSHLVVGVTDMDRALGFYRGLLGMDVVFDQAMSGEPFDHALGGSGEHRGRVVGGLGGAVAEVLSEQYPVPLKRVGIADRFAETGPYTALLDRYGMAVQDIVAAAGHVVRMKSGSRTKA